MRRKRRDSVVLASGEEKIQRELLGRWWLLCLGEELLCRWLKSKACVWRLRKKKNQKVGGVAGGLVLVRGEKIWLLGFLFCVPSP